MTSHTIQLSSEYWKIFKNNYFKEHLQTATSDKV